MTIQDSNTHHLDTTFTQWRKSSYSNPNGNEYVEVSFINNAIGIRDSHHTHGAMLAVGHAEWMTFLDGISDGMAC
ncbi:MAG: DUF397 domain-containing protein [Pseudonocardiaceae bacterium]